MENFQELLSCAALTVFLSLLASFVISKLLAMEGSRDLAPKNSMSVSATNVIQKSVTLERPKKGNRSFVVECECECEREREREREGRTFSTVGSLDDDQTGSRADARGSPLRPRALSDETVCSGLASDEIANGVETSREAGGVTIDDADYAYLVFDESPVSREDLVVREIEIESDIDEVSVANLMKLDGLERNVEEGWQEIERSELEKHFGDATIFVEGSKSLENDVKLQLYGLSKIVLKGPCIAPQPMALKITARAKWKAWQQLTHMSRETAMEQYISLLSKSIPDWKGRDVNVEFKMKVLKEETNDLANPLEFF